MTSPDNAIKYIDRASGSICTESVMGNCALKFAYNTLLGRSLWGLLFNTGFLSRLMGSYYDSPKSKKHIAKLLEIPGISPDEAEKDWHCYQSFNDFFTRKLKPECRPLAEGENILCSPADGRLLVYPEISPASPMPVKGAMRSLNALCQTGLPADRYSVAVVRLAPIDYHRYHFPCDCRQNGDEIFISGKYHSVNPIAFAKAPDLFVENTRCITPFTSERSGDFFFLEIGAFGVGSIVNTAKGGTYAKGDEKGFFKFGGSTVILVMDTNKVTFDADLIKNSSSGMETLVRFGEKIATME